jgi:hypothetical protein
MQRVLHIFDCDTLKVSGLVGATWFPVGLHKSDADDISAWLGVVEFAIKIAIAGFAFLYIRKKYRQLK